MLTGILKDKIALWGKVGDWDVSLFIDEAKI